ncbi:NineTeen Complex (NTC) component [Saitozyma podzolica]|uniref:NineTeen Complex (NTC) component n=1 Tax=Saitozyma podzolica TaxID=1890683 RepID=A0A427YJ33_9TREE|nr:NineTeen Complex (NTC) component [Saitozyma podzolica]
MARNSEKAQSMLYRFRETQAIEMGLGNRVKGERRPRMASSVTSLRECERWRGDILKEISRKVSKIQDASLTDYEIRDLNDEINSLMREKRHFENQIVNLGGANYKRGQAAMVDDDGREVPGTRGYKYFGRARELPGVKELFTRGATQASEESARNASFQMFRHQGPEYYGDVDEMDAKLAQEEDELARRDWDAAVAETSEALGLATPSSVPYPADSKPPSIPAESSAGAKRKAGDTDANGVNGVKGVNGVHGVSGDASESSGAEESAKKAKMTNNGESTEDGGGGAAVVPVADPAAAAAARQAAVAASFLSVLNPESLKMPTMPTTEEMGKVLLEVRKKALREEYGV